MGILLRCICSERVAVDVVAGIAHALFLPDPCDEHCPQAFKVPAAPSCEPHLKEVKGLITESGIISLTPNKRRIAEDRRDCFWLYVVTNCAAEPQLQKPIEGPARFSWHEGNKVQHYWLEIDAMTEPM